MKKCIINHKEVILYLFFGGCTTGINVIAYWICVHFFNVGVTVGTLGAWLLAVLFAFVTNKSWVFGSKSWEKDVVKKEMLSFFSCRTITGLMDMVIMCVSVELLHWNDIFMKVISNILVIIINYVVSKIAIFKKSS